MNRDTLYCLIQVDEMKRIGPTSESPRLLYEWAQREGWGLGTVAVMPWRQPLQKRATVAREARRHAREVREERAMDRDCSREVSAMMDSIEPRVVNW